jgi:NTE family protein
MMQYTDLVENFNLPTAEYNPNKVAELTGGVDKGKEIFKKLLWDFIQFDKVEALIENFTKKNKRAPISLYLGAVDVLAGKFHHFTYADLAKHNGKYGAEAIIASACIPTLFTPVELNGTCYWDGLFSENPPVVCLAKEIVDEMWIIRINPRATPNIPRTTYDIDDRRNELSGNLALELALDGIQLVNRMLKQNAFSPEYIRKKGLKPIDVKEITVVDNTVRSRYGYDLGGASKLDRDPQFIAAMTEHGYEQAEEFFLNRKKEVMQAV